VLGSDKKWWIQHFKSLKIVVSNVKLLFFVSLTIALRALVSKTHSIIIVQNIGFIWLNNGNIEKLLWKWLKIGEIEALESVPS